MAGKPPITLERLREVLDYDPVTGAFRWLICTAMCTVVGSIAGSVDHRGYRRIQIDGDMHIAHRLAWLYFYGVWPTAEIDHVNRCRDDNRIENLRMATVSQNKANRTLHRNNTSGFKGVSYFSRTGRWKAGIGHQGRYIHLGYFATPEEAHAAYMTKASEYFGEFASDGQVSG